MIIPARTAFLRQAPAAAAGGSFYSNFVFRGAQAVFGDAASRTFSAQPIGTANPDRQVIVAAAVSQGAGPGLSCTIGGVAAFQSVGIDDEGSAAACLWSLNVTSGTTANIVIGSASIGSAWHMAYWTLDCPDVGFFTYDTATRLGASTGAALPSINIPAGGLAFAFGFEYATRSDINGSINASFVEDADQMDSASLGNSLAAHREVISATAVAPTISWPGAVAGNALSLQVSFIG